jgi:predicted nucleotidyltransferase component of viral defense system
MIVLTQKDVLAHEVVVPWSEPYQIEQDLLLCLAMRAIFEDRFLSDQVAMRGGTVLHKVHLAPAARYSEDIDLVAVGDRPEGHIRKSLLRVLRPVLGRERSSVWDSVQLAVRNAAKPSRILRCIYKVPSVVHPGRELTIEVETNVTERIPHFPVQRLPFTIQFRGETVGTEIVSYNINEMLATKMRALFQRRKGRDLFDLYWALSVRSALPVSVAEILQAFDHYMRAEGEPVARERFIAHLHECLADRAGFCTDIDSFLQRDLTYDPDVAGALVERDLLRLLPA